MPPAATVIIPTYNGAHRIKNALHSLEKQSNKNFETIIVIDGSTDNTEDILKNTRFDLEAFQVIKQENGGRSKVRNRGAREAHSELLIFMDDDMRFAENTVDQHIMHHHGHGSSILGGNQFEDKALLTRDIQHYKLHLSESWLQKYSEGLNRLSSDNLFLTAANMSVKKKLFDALRGFDERLTDAEDTDLAMRAISDGIPVFFNSKIIGWHDDFITCRSYVKRRREYEKANKQIEVSGSVSAVKKILYWPFSHKILIRMTDANFFKYTLPKSIRYKLYSFIIWGFSRYYPSKSI